MEDKATLQMLLVAQVLTLAKTLEVQVKVEGKTVSMDFEREAVRLMTARKEAVLRLLGPAG